MLDTNAWYTPTVNGNYYCLITDTNGCQTPSNVVGFFLGTSTFSGANAKTPLMVHNNQIYYNLPETKEPITLVVYNMQGAIQQHIQVRGQGSLMLQNIAAGCY